jgi:hypothetical protein
MSETKLSASISAALTKLGYPVIRVQAGTARMGRYYVHMAARGTPDRIVLLRRGRVVWLEVKTASGILSADQVAWHARAAERGHVVRVVKSVTDAINAVREVDAA